MADTLVLGTSGEIRASSSLAWGTKIVDSDSKALYNSNMWDGGEIGRHKRLKISRRKACRFDSGSSYQEHIERR